MPKIPEPRISFDDFCRAISRHKRKMCGFSLSVIVLVAAVTLLSDKVYRSEGKLLVRLGRENVTLDATSTLGNAPVVAIPTDRVHEINSIVQILRSRVLAEHVVDALGPQAILNPGKKTKSEVETCILPITGSETHPVFDNSNCPQVYITCMALRNHAACIGNDCDAVLGGEIVTSAACWHSSG